MMRAIAPVGLISLLLLGFTATSSGQTAATQPASPAASQPAGEPGQARVILVSGTVSAASVSPEGVRGEWRAVNVGDMLPAGTQIRTQIRSKVGLSFGDNAVVLIERATLASIDQFRRSGDGQQVNLGLGHGMIRGSAADTTLRSDMTIATPTATLSKRGTHDFGMEYDPSTHRFRVWLGGEGLVEALNMLTNQSRLLRRQQYVTQAMLRWIETLANGRWVQVVDTFGQTSSEFVFNRDQGQDGLGVVNPGGGATTFFVAGQNEISLTGRINPASQTPVLILSPNRGRTGTTIIPRPEGNFGTGTKAVR